MTRRDLKGWFVDKLGIDAAVLYVFLNRAWGMLSGVVFIVLISSFLSEAEQGYYYTFNSIAAIQVFFELGLGVVLSQFAGHEFVRLHWCDDALAGDGQALARLHSLLRLALQWYAVIALLMVLGVLPAGVMFFSRSHMDANVHWLGAWVALVLALAANLLLTPVNAMLEGCGKVVELGRVRLWQSVVGVVAAALLFASGAKLYAATAVPLVSAIVGWVYIHRCFATLVKCALAVRHSALHWMAEVWPLQWRIALSWISGYFIFQLFNPVLFAYQSSVVAGKMGMSMSVFFSLQVVAISWLNTKSFRFNALIAQRRFDELDRLFFTALRQSFLVLGVGIVSVLAAIKMLALAGYAVADRFLTFSDLVLLMLAALVNHLVNSLAIYLRAHKKEPFLWLSLAMGGVTGVSTWYFGKYHGVTQVLLAYLLITVFIGVVWGGWIFHAFRRTYHQPHPDDR